MGPSWDLITNGDSKLLVQISHSKVSTDKNPTLNKETKKKNPSSIHKSIWCTKLLQL